MSSTDRHLHQIDLVRVLVFSAVIAVHTIANANADSSEASGALLMALHFTREAFFALSGFVLVYSQRDSSRPPGRAFVFRRVRLVLTPYLAWTVIYWADATAVTPPNTVGSALRTLGIDAGEGTAAYHLYFLLVTMQIYLVFGALVWLLRKTQGHHLALLVGTAVFETALTGWLHYVWTPGGVASGFISHAGTLLPSYLLWVIGGGVAALHREAFDDWVRAHDRLIAAGFVLGLGAAEASYAIEIGNNATPLHAAEVLQPVMLLWSAAAMVALYAVGLAWASRPKRPAGTLIAQASLASFGVFLVHPLLIQVVVKHGLGPDDSVLQSGLATLLAYVLVVMGSVVAVSVFLRTPLSTMLTGRPRLARPAAGHRRHRIVTVGRLAAVTATLLVTGSVVAIGRVNDRDHAARLSANEFSPVDSLVTTPAAGSSSGSASQPTLTPSRPPVETTVSITVGTLQRSYLLVAPAGGTAHLPVLIFLHGVTTTPSQELARDGFLPLAEDGQAVLVYPGGYRGSWNAGDGCCGAALTADVDDVSFIRDVAAAVARNQHTDPGRVYLGGYSNGAKLVWKIACDSPSGFTAFAEFGGNPAGCANLARAPFFLGVGGVDGTEPIAGKKPDDRGPHPAIEPELSTIVAGNGCEPTGQVTMVSTAMITSWTGCSHAPVTYVDWTTEDHHWPRPPVVTPAGSAATLMWSFFSAQKTK